MAWHEQGPSGNYFICLRIGEKRFRRSLKTNDKEDADSDLARIEDNLRQVERGWLTVPKNADIVSFLLSNGRVTEPLAVPDQLTLQALFDRFLLLLFRCHHEKFNRTTPKKSNTHNRERHGRSAFVVTFTNNV